MLILEVEYLTERAVATARHGREQPEWPPHPGRLFSALVAACHEADLPDHEREAGREALLWLEALDPPAIAVRSAIARQVTPVFVPVNDVEVPEVRANRPASKGQLASAAEVLPERRPKQPRYFPSVRPEQAVLHFVWRASSGLEQHRPALAQIAECVTYLGHSSSLIRVSLADAHGEITYEPAADGNRMLRVPTRGRLNELERDHRRQARPSPGTYEVYREVGILKPAPLPETASVFGDMIVCRLHGPSLPLTGMLRLTCAVRDSMIAHANQSDTRLLELLSGHTADGGLSKEDHVAYIPLANIGPHRYADGLIKGFALVLPSGLGRLSRERRAILRALVGVSEIAFGAQGPWQVDIPQAGEELKSLRPQPYARAWKTWATVTPVLCDRFPKDKDGQRVEDVIRGSCRRVLGIEPTVIAVSPVSWHRGVPPSHAFGRIRKPGEPPRHRTHVLLKFDRNVRGPILLGGGRFAGLGLFRALAERGED